MVSEKSIWNVMDWPGGMLAGVGGAPESAKPVPETVRVGTVTAFIVVCGLVTVKVRTGVVNAMGVAGCAVNLTWFWST